MEKVGFIGAFDKIDLILYVAKLLTIANKKVLIADTTILQKARYVVPSIDPTVSYITEYEEIDIAVGFYSLDDIIHYLGKNSEQEMGYDYILVDIDSYNVIKNYGINNQTKNYFVTSFDTYSIKRGLETLAGIPEPIPLTKIIFSKEVSKSENDYLEYLALGYKVMWNEYKIYFPLEQGDQTAISNNQRVAKIKFGNLTNQYKDSLTSIAEDILKEINSNKFKKMLKNLE